MGTILSYPDHTKTATLGGGSWSTTLDNLKTGLLSQKARSANALAASTIITIDLGATARAIRCIAALAHTISYAGTIRARGYSDSGYTTLVSGADTGTVYAWPQSGFTAADAAQYPTNWIYCFSTSKTARYWKIEIVDTANSAGYIELGGLWLGEAAFEPAVGIQYGSSLFYESRDLVQDSIGGVIWGEKRSARRSTTISFPNITATERNKALIMQKTLGKTDQLLFVMDSLDSAQDMLLQAFPATIRQASPLTYPYFNNHEMPLELQEII